MSPDPVETRRKGLAITFAGVLILTPDGVLTRMVSADTLTLLFWREALAATALFLFYLIAFRGSAISRFRSIGRRGLWAAVFFALSTICFVYAIRLTTVANTLVIIATTPLLTALLARAFLGEAIDRRTGIAIVIGLGCIAGIFGSDLSDFGGAIGDLCAFVSALTAAAVFTLFRHGKEIDMVPAIALAAAMVAAGSAFFVPTFALAGKDVLWVGLLGLVILPLAFGLISVGPRYLPAAEVSLIMLLETVLGPLWAWLVLTEVPETATLIGGTILVGTLFLHGWLGLRDERRNRIDAV